MSEQVQTVSAQTSSQTIRVAIAELKPHPLEAGKSSANPSRELRALADRMASQGQLDPIEVLPDFTVVSDHEPVRAARLLNWTELDAIVRADLADQGEVAIEEHVLLARLDRAGRHKLEVARDLKRLHEIGWNDLRAHRRQSDDLHPCQRRDLRSLLAETLDQKGRSLTRWMAVLEAPVEVQDAFIRKEINLVEAEAVGHLRPNVKEEIVQAIQSGGGVKEVIAAHLPSRDGKHRFTEAALATLLRSLKRSKTDFDGREDEIKFVEAQVIQDLDEGIALLQQLREQVQEKGPDPMAAWLEAHGPIVPFTRRRKRRMVSDSNCIQLP